MDEAIQEFLIESDENLSQVERDLLLLENHPEGQDALASIFRAIHTVKGTCSFLGYAKLESLAHTGETLLSLVRDEEIALTPEIITALLTMVDAIRKMLACIQERNTDGDDEFWELKALLTKLQNDPSHSPKSEISTLEPCEATEADLTNRSTEKIDSTISNRADGEQEEVLILPCITGQGGGGDWGHGGDRSIRQYSSGD